MKRKIPIKLTASIYRIVHVATDRCYVGHSVNVKNRWREHRRHLRRNEHHSKTLQRAWNKYGASAFVFEILEVCLRRDRLVREQFWIDQLCPLYNGAPVAGSVLGIRFTRPKEFGLAVALRNKQRTKEYHREVAKKIKQTFAEKIYTPEWREKHSVKTRAAVSGKKIPKPESWKCQHRQRMLTNHPRPWLGRKHTEETKAKMRAAWVCRKKNLNG